MEIPLAAEAIFHIGSWPVTNSMINAWIAVVFFVLIGLAVRNKKAAVPRGIQNVMEAIVEFMTDFIVKLVGDRKRAEQFLPIVGTLFLFILISNWMGLIPGTGTIGIWEMHHGKIVLVPFLRPAGSDLNMTLAMALLAVTVSHFAGIVAIGFFNHLNKFVQLGSVFKSITKGPLAIFVALIEFVVGLIEIVSEVAKVVSLSLRLFGNIFAGEVLLTVMIGLIAYGVPIQFMLMELIVEFVHALVFAGLVLVYLMVAVSEPHEQEAY